MAARSTHVTFRNLTHTTLAKSGEDLAHGEWTTDPPWSIGPGAQAEWESESDGFMTGTEGWVRYYPLQPGAPGIPDPTPDESTIYLHWDNPWSGSNSYDQSAPAPYAVNREGDGGGDNANIGFSLSGAYGPDTCAEGYVWRDAGPNDHVCVPPETRDQAAYDNGQAASRVEPGGGPYGPDTCQQGYVWREAFPGDHVCVPPETRAQAASDNATAGDRLL